MSKNALNLKNRKKLGVYKSVFPSFFLATKPTIRNTWRSVPSLLQSLLNASLETQGRSVGPGEKARRNILSTGGKAPWYRLSPDHFQEVKRMLAPDWAQKMFCIIVPNRRTHLLSYFRAFLRDGYCLDHGLSGSCTKEMHVVRKLSV